MTRLYFSSGSGSEFHWSRKILKIVSKRWRSYIWKVLSFLLYFFNFLQPITISLKKTQIRKVSIFQKSSNFRQEWLTKSRWTVIIIINHKCWKSNYFDFSSSSLSLSLVLFLCFTLNFKYFSLNQHLSLSEKFLFTNRIFFLEKLYQEWEHSKVQH